MSLCDHTHRHRPLLDVDEAIDHLLGAVDRHTAARTVELVPLERAAGRVLAQPVGLDRDEPPRPRSAMDGYALRAAEGRSPRRRVGAVHAGDRPADRPLMPGEAIAVMTGGTVPEGADAVVPVELVEVRGDEVCPREAPRPGQHIRQAGEMGRAGRAVVDAGRRLTLEDLIALAGCGARQVPCYGRPSVALLSTGNEVVPWTATPGPHQVRDSNRFGLALQVRRAGATVAVEAHIRDEPEALVEAIDGAAQRADIVVTIGGVSMGAKDHVPGAFEAAGFSELFHGVAVQPGKPLWAGRRASTLALGLPGNPLSSFVIAELFLVPVIDLSSGRRGAGPRRFETALAGAPMRAKGRLRLIPAALSVSDQGAVVATPRPSRGSGDWTSLAGAEALACIAPHTQVAPGDAIRMVRLDHRPDRYGATAGGP